MMVFSTRMYALADKYIVPSLKESAKAHFSKYVDDVVIYKLDFFVHLKEGFLMTLRIIYRSTPSSDRGLRDALVPFVKEYQPVLQEDQDFLALMRDGFGDGELATDMFEAMVKSPAKRQKR